MPGAFLFIKKFLHSSDSILETNKTGISSVVITLITCNEKSIRRVILIAFLKRFFVLFCLDKSYDNLRLLESIVIGFSQVLLNPDIASIVTDFKVLYFSNHVIYGLKFNRMLK